MQKQAVRRYEFPLENFTTPAKFERIKAFGKDKETPFLVIDLDVIKANYEALRANLPYAKIYYAVKANPHDEVVALLRDLGSNFDVASRFELDQLLRPRREPGPAILRQHDQERARHRLLLREGRAALRRPKRHRTSTRSPRGAPGSRVFLRLLTEGLGADWPLSKKFGLATPTSRDNS